MGRRFCGLTAKVVPSGGGSVGMVRRGKKVEGEVVGGVEGGGLRFLFILDTWLPDDGEDRMRHNETYFVLFFETDFVKSDFVKISTITK